LKHKKPKIMIIGSLPPPFIGPSIAMSNLVQSIDIQKTFNVIFLDISDRRDPTNIGRFDLQNIFLGLKHFVKFIFLLFFKNPEIVYFNISQGLWGYLRDLSFFIPSVVFCKKLIIHLRGSEFHKFYLNMSIILQNITRFLFKRVTFVIVLSENLKSCFKSLVKKNKVVAISNGINFKKFDQVKNISVKRDFSKRILYVSSLQYRKGIFNFLESIPMVLKKHPDIDVTIVGEWQNKKDKEKALDYIRLNKLEKIIHLTGELSGTSKIRQYKEHGIFVFPPIQPEGLPWVILEAMSARLPVVSTNQGAIQEVILDGKTGFIIKPLPKNIAEKISYLIENPEKAKIMGESGRHRVERHFSEDIYLRNIANTFKEALIN